MRRSLKEYAVALGYWAFLVVLPIALDCIGVWQLISGDQVAGVPSWVWFQVAFVSLLLIPFIAFHKLSVRLHEATDERAHAFARLVLEVRNKAAKVVSLRDSASQSAMADASKEYEDAMDSLSVEAGIDGGKVKEAVSPFTTFVQFHVARLLGAIGPILGADEKTRKEIETDELTFDGKMAAKADETIRRIRAVLAK